MKHARSTYAIEVKVQSRYCRSNRTPCRSLRCSCLYIRMIEYTGAGCRPVALTAIGKNH